MSVAVIGGGVAGFAAAIEAAGAGSRVVLFDARRCAGGRARTANEQGFLINEGAHALYLDGAANRFLRELDREPAGGTPNTSDGVGIDGARSGAFPAGVSSVLRTPLLKGDRAPFIKLLARIGRLDPSEFADTAVTQTIEELLGTGRAAAMGHALLRLSTYGNDPDHASGDAGLAQLKMAVGGGVRYVHGGWQTIVDSLAAEATSRGVVIRTGSKVDAVHADEAVVTLDVGGSTERFDGVVLAVGGPRNVSRLLGERSPAVRGWQRDARPARVASLDVGLDVGWGPFAPFALGIDSPLYLSVHAPVARLAPSGCTLVHVARYLDPNEEDDPDRDRAACEGLLDRIRPQWRNHIVHVGFQRGLVAAFDQPRAAAGGLPGRPGIAVPEMAGVFVAGDWVGPTGLLADASAASGRSAGLGVAAFRNAAAAR